MTLMYFARSNDHSHVKSDNTLFACSFDVLCGLRDYRGIDVFGGIIGG